MMQVGRKEEEKNAAWGVEKNRGKIVKNEKK